MDIAHIIWIAGAILVYGGLIGLIVATYNKLKK